jgi:hypothetical protein
MSTLPTNIGMMVMQISQLQDEATQRFQLLAEIIRNDQLTHEQVQKLILDTDPQFAAWYKKRGVA